MQRHFIWQADYGNRSHLVSVLSNLLDNQNANSLQMAAIFVNDIPYNLEFYVALGYDKPQENHIEDMLKSLRNADLVYRPDITFQELFSGIGERRFNSWSFVDSSTLKSIFPIFFAFPEKKAFIEEGYKFSSPLGKELPIFLSHQSQNKADIEELIPYLNASGLPTWFDKYNIDYGESIVEAVQKGIKNSIAVIFWITKEFLESNWCKREMNSFLNRFASESNVLIISVVEKDINLKELNEIFIFELKYFQRTDETIEEVAKELLPTINKYYNRI